MNILISASSGKPIYEQITAQIKAAILSEELHAGDALPPMRTLAKDLHISVITTKRAYEELERDGFIVTLQGKGCFVAGVSTQALREEKLRRVEELLGAALAEARSAGIPDGEVHALLRLLAGQD